MASDSPTPSSPPTIFIDSEDKPLDIFVCSGTRNQFRLSRAISKHGGRIVDTVAEAQILIADDSDQADRDFTKAWCNEPGKVLLDAQWVFSSVLYGEWPDEENNWGGFCLNAKNSIHNSNADNIEEGSGIPRRAKKRPMEPERPQSKRVGTQLSQDVVATSTRETLGPTNTTRSPSPSSIPAPPAPTQANSSTNSSQKLLFTQANGTPSSFYVQVSLKNRMSILSCIRRCGGKISSSLKECDYAILDQNSKEFSIMAEEDRPMYSPSWPALCERFGSLVDNDDVRLVPPPKRPAKRSRNRL